MEVFFLWWKTYWQKGQLFSLLEVEIHGAGFRSFATNYLAANPDLQQDWETYRKLPRDPRVTTKTARLIRKLSLDELPQL